MNKRPTMKEVVLELRSIARRHGFKVRYYTYDRLKDESHVRNFSPTFPSGAFYQISKKIVIRKYKNTFYHSLMCVLAHEISHLLHFVEGKYSKFYSDIWLEQVKSHAAGNKIYIIDVSCFLQGVRAERDCDAWAIRFLSERGYQYNPRMARKYPTSSVMGYSLYKDYLDMVRKDA